MTTPLKHAVLIKKWADGATIQQKDQNGKWCDVWMNYPSWDDVTEFRVKPEIPEGFTPWEGGDCPVDPRCFVEIKLRSGFTDCQFAEEFYWKNCGCFDDIIAYRVIKQAPVARWQWIVKPNKGGHRSQPELTQRFYKDEKTLIRDMGSLWDVIGKAEWTRTEFAQ